MDQYFISMNEEFRRKHYPNGFFAYVRKSKNSSKTFLYIFCGIILTFFAACTLSGIWILIRSIQDGADDIGPLIVIDLIGLVFCGLLIFVIRLASGLGGMTEEDWIGECAKSAHYSAADIREFGNQVVASDTCILHLDGKTGSNSDTGFLTRDYIFFNLYKIIKVSDITLACFTEYIDSSLANTGKKSIAITTHEFQIALISKQKNLARMKATQESGRLLMAMLKERNPDIDIREDGVIKLKELERMCEA